MSLKKVIFKNVAAGWFGKLILILTTIIMTPLLISHFGKHDYGIWLMVGQGTSFLMLLDFGIANSVSRFVSKNIVLKNNTENNQVYSTAIAIFSGFSILIMITILIVSPFVPAILNVAESQKNIIYWVFGLTGLNVALIFPFRVGNGLLQAKDKYDIIAFVEVFFNLLKLFLVVSFFRDGNNGLIVLAVIFFILNLSNAVTLFCLATKKYYPELEFEFKSITIRNFKEMSSLGNSAFLQTLSGMMGAKLPILIIGVWLSVGATTLYSIPNALLRKLSPFITMLGSTFVPIASRLDAENKYKQLTQLNIIGVRYGLIMSIPICVFLFFFADNLLFVWIGKSGLSEEDLSTMYNLIKIMIIPFALGTPQIATRSILNATGKHWVSAITQFVCTLIGIGCGLLLMIFADMGITGIAIGWALKIILSDILALPLLYCKYFKVSVFIYYKNVYASPLLLAFVLFLFCLIFGKVIIVSGVFEFIICTVVFGIVTLLGIYSIGLLPIHRSYLNGKLRRLMVKFSF